MTDKHTPDLCPFCKSDAEHIERHNPMSKWKHSIDCKRCGASGPVEATKAEAIAGWNLGASHDVGLIEALQRIATVDMGGGFLGAQACRKVAIEALANVRGLS